MHNGPVHEQTAVRLNAYRVFMSSLPHIILDEPESDQYCDISHRCNLKDNTFTLPHRWSFLFMSVTCGIVMASGFEEKSLKEGFLPVFDILHWMDSQLVLQV